jgi:phage gpG-like protein
MQARIDGREILVELDKLERRARSLSRVMPVTAEALVAAVSDVYEAEGPGWEPLAASTLKQRRGSSAKILQDTGVMAASTTPSHGNDWAVATAGEPYAEFHATGTRHMPKRNPFDLGAALDPVLEDIADLLAQEAVKP